MTNELDAERLPRVCGGFILAALAIEDAYSIVKRLLGLAYFWCGAQNAVKCRLGYCYVYGLD